MNTYDEATAILCKLCAGQGWVPIRKSPAARLADISEDGLHAKCPRCNGRGSVVHIDGNRLGVGMAETFPVREIGGSLVMKMGDSAGGIVCMVIAAGAAPFLILFAMKLIQGGP